MEEETDIIKKQGLLKQLVLTGQLTRFMVYLSAAIPAVILIVLAVFSLPGVEILKPAKFGSIIIGTWYDYIVLSVIIFTGVYGIYEYLRLRKVRKIDERFPDFVRDLAESRRAGMTFTKAILHAAKGNYGVLTPEIQKIARQISWGSSVDDALNSFAKRVNTKLIRRTVSLIIEASRSGGNVADVLDAASRDAREIKLIDAERRAGLMSYVAVIYIGMGVFILIILVLCKSLLPAMTGAAGAQLQSEAMNAGATGGRMSMKDVTQLFFTAALIQTGLMGLVTGVFEEGTVVSGVKHSFIMLLVTWLAFKLLITGI
ncbi:MAG: type II secretion system F family protein [Thermoplasmata archaeon]|nr:MAG: type II secretion system F family protein [Thermoplasmata archaeon]